MAFIMAGCMRRTKEERVNVIPSMRLSLIDGQLKSWFPFTRLWAESLHLSVCSSLLQAVITSDKRPLFAPEYPCIHSVFTWKTTCSRVNWPVLQTVLCEKYFYFIINSVLVLLYFLYFSV